MIEISIYYMIGSIIGLPVITTLINKYYYDKKNKELIEYYKGLINEEKIRLENQLTRFQRNRKTISKFMETRLENKN